MPLDAMLWVMQQEEKRREEKREGWIRMFVLHKHFAETETDIGPWTLWVNYTVEIQKLRGHHKFLEEIQDTKQKTSCQNTVK